MSDVPPLPTGDSTLHESDRRIIYEVLYEVRAKSKMLGLVLGLEKSTVEVIHMDYRDPADQLVQVIAEFLKQAEPRTTWRVIVNALRSPLIGMHALAKKIEAKYSIVPATKSDILTSSSPLQEKYKYNMDATLTMRDLVGVAEELYELRAKLKILGLVLGLPEPTVDAIQVQYRDLTEQLLEVIAKFLQQVEPRPTWRVIVDVFRNPIVTQPAMEVEAAHSRTLPISGGSSVGEGSDDMVKVEPVSPVNPLVPVVSKRARTGKLETMKDVIFVEGILAKHLKRDDIFTLFNTLGLSETTVKAEYDIADNKKYAHGLIVAWRNEQDDVLMKYPAGSTWENLRKALTDIGHRGTANRLQ